MEGDRARALDREHIIELWQKIDSERDIFIGEIKDLLELCVLIFLYKKEYMTNDIACAKNAAALLEEIADELSEYNLDLLFDEKDIFKV